LGPGKSGSGLVAIRTISRTGAGIEEGERNAILNGGHARDGPTTEYRIRDAFELTGGNQPTVIDDEPLGPVVIRRAVLLCQITGIVAIG
jgi:hypothetical protein